MRVPVLIAVVLLIACAERQPPPPAPFAIHGFEPWASEYRTGAPPVILHALLSYEGDRERLSKAGAKIGTLYSPEAPSERIAYTIAAYGATHMIRTDVVEHVETINTRTWTSCYNNFGTVQCSSVGGPQELRSFTYVYELFRVERANWSALPLPMQPVNMPWRPPPEPPKPAAPPPGCEWTHRDSFGRHDNFKLFLRCEGKPLVELDPETHKPIERK